MKRQRHVMPLREVIRHWVAQDQDSARMGGKGVYRFEGPALYERERKIARLARGRTTKFIFGNIPYKISRLLYDYDCTVYDSYGYKYVIDNESECIWRQVARTMYTPTYPCGVKDLDWYRRILQNVAGSIAQMYERIGRYVGEFGDSLLDCVLCEKRNLTIRQAFVPTVRSGKMDIRGVWRNLIAEDEDLCRAEQLYIEHIGYDAYSHLWSDVLSAYREKGDVGSNEFYDVWQKIV